MTEKEGLKLEPLHQFLLDLTTALLGILLLLTFFLPWWRTENLLGEYGEMEINGLGYGKAAALKGVELDTINLESVHILMQAIVLILLSLSLIFSAIYHFSNDEMLKVKIKVILSTTIVTIVIFWIILHGYYRVKFMDTGETVSLGEIEDFYSGDEIISSAPTGIGNGTIIALIIGFALLTISLVELYLKNYQRPNKTVLEVKLRKT